MASKWAALVGTIPNIPPDASYDQAMIAKVDALREFSVADLVDLYNKADEVRDERKKALSEAEFDLEALTRALTDKMDTESLESVTAHGYKFTPVPEPHPTVKDKAALRAWAQTHMPDNLALPWQTLKAVTKESLENGDTLPAGIDVFLKRSLRRTKA